MRQPSRQGYAMNFKAFGLAGLAVSLFSLPVSAHHSFAMFDGEKTLTLKGTVKELEWTNPHAWLYVMVQDQSGKAIEYSLEMPGTGQSVELGWKPDSIKAGDVVSVDIHPLKTGGHGGELLGVVLPSGQKLGVTGKGRSPSGE